MKFLMLVLAEESGLDVSENDAPRFGDWVQRHGNSGVHVVGSRLRPAQEACTVRVRDNRLQISHAPFAPGGIAIGGFDVLECESWEHAIEVAAEHPMAHLGAIELRAFWPYDQE